MKKSAWPILAVVFAMPAMAQNVEHQNRGVEPGTTSGTAAGTSGTVGNGGQAGKAAPSTQPGQANVGTSGAGMESRGSRTAPPSNEEGKPTTGH